MIGKQTNMRNGKISESVLKRSVLKKIQPNREETICGAGIGMDCAVLSLGDKETAVSTETVSGSPVNVCRYAIYRALNNVAASGAEPVAVMLSFMLPVGTEEAELKAMMDQAAEICRRENVQITGGHTEVTAAVKEAVVTAAGIGKRACGSRVYQGSAGPGQDIVASKWIGLEGSVRLAEEYADRLASRYPERMIEEVENFAGYLSVIPEAAVAVSSGVRAMHDASQGGIFAALWELAESAGVGLEIDLKKIPVRQETIEICEFFVLNPYELSSTGCLLMVTPDGAGLAAALQKEGIPAVIVGRTTAGNDRVLFNEDEKRFLEPPKADQMYNI